MATVARFTGTKDFINGLGITLTLSVLPVFAIADGWRFFSDDSASK